MRASLFLGIFLIVMAHALPGGAEEVETTVHIYKAVNDTTLTLAVEHPTGEGPFPVVVYIHGGTWSLGDYQQFEGHSRHLAARGVAGVRIHYRKAPQGAVLADTMADVLDAVEWVRQHAEEYSFDLSRLGIAGASAGAHLGGLAVPQVPETVAFVGVNGVYDIEAAEPNLRRLKFPFERYFGPITEEHLREESPHHQIGIKPPPALLFHGTHDEIVPVTQSLKYANALHKRGGDARVILYAGEDHGYSKNPEARADETLEYMTVFLLRTLEVASE